MNEFTRSITLNDVFRHYFLMYIKYHPNTTPSVHTYIHLFTIKLMSRINIVENVLYSIWQSALCSNGRASKVSDK